MKFRSLLPVAWIILGVTLTITIGGCGGGASEDATTGGGTTGGGTTGGGTTGGGTTGGGTTGGGTTGGGKTYKITIESLDVREVSTGKLLSGADAPIVGQEVMFK